MKNIRDHRHSLARLSSCSTICPAAEVRSIVDALRSQDLLEYVLIESSGNISDANFEAYADCGADAISIGALTHSVRALDLSLALA